MSDSLQRDSGGESRNAWGIIGRQTHRRPGKHLLTSSYDDKGDWIGREKWWTILGGLSH